MPWPLLLLAKVGLGCVGTPLLEAIAEEDVEFAEADVGRRTELGAGFVPNVGTLRTEAIESEDVEFAEADADDGGSRFFVNDMDEPLACKEKLMVFSYQNCSLLSLYKSIA